MAINVRLEERKIKQEGLKKQEIFHNKPQLIVQETENCIPHKSQNVPAEKNGLVDFKNLEVSNIRALEEFIYFLSSNKENKNDLLKNSNEITQNLIDGRHIYYR